MENVEGKVAFVTGGASGIGLGIARSFVNAGMKVAIADIRQEALRNVDAEFVEAGKGERVVTIQLDVVDRKAMASAADAVESAFGKVHVLVNNAGIGIGGPVKDAKYDDWDWGLGVNLGGVINGIQEFLPRLLAHGEGGHIINTSSMAAVVPMRVASIYITAKAAVLGLSEELRGELEPDNIGVSAFCPGPVQTNISQCGELRPERYRANSGYAEVEARLKERQNSPLWMEPDEVGERVLAGLRRNDLFIFTHREFKEGLAQRCQKMLDSFPDEEIDTGRYEEIKWLAENAIYRG
ncbi:MAG TPA: SDR family NAD(P)-dependent oxidoreductase [Woeseiaceae bacterium]|nr:SDR family NAD(P)-dependent oxidoreductase [Woeseiaceae bacterium]